MIGGRNKFETIFDSTMTPAMIAAAYFMLIVGVICFAYDIKPLAWCLLVGAGAIAVFYSIILYSMIVVERMEEDNDTTRKDHEGNR